MGTWTQLNRFISEQRKSRTRPVLVLGSGLLHECGLGKSADWTRMLRSVASELRVPFDKHAAEEFPTLYWDALIHSARVAHPKQFSSNKAVESAARQAVKAFVGKPPQRPTRPNLGTDLLKADVLAVISLNFTLVPFGDAKSTPIRSGNQVGGLNICSKCVWFPHGHLDRLDSLTLGTRAYSNVLRLMEMERGTAHASRKPDGPKSVSMLNDCLQAPLIFAGCGLRDVEWTMYWLLATRLRASSVDARACESWFVTDRVPSASRIALLKAVGCHVLYEPCHTRYWDQLLEVLRKPQRAQVSATPSRAHDSVGCKTCFPAATSRGRVTGKS